MLRPSPGGGGGGKRSPALNSKYTNVRGKMNHHKVTLFYFSSWSFPACLLLSNITS
jgi:hypothetical protein